MKKHDIIWLAGLLEGEGCFNYRADRNQARISVEMTDRDVIERVATLFGTGVSVRAPRPTGKCSTCKGSPHECRFSNHYPEIFFTMTKESYQTAVHGRKAERLMILVYPFMGERRSGKIREIVGELP